MSSNGSTSGGSGNGDRQSSYDPESSNVQAAGHGQVSHNNQAYSGYQPSSSSTAMAAGQHHDPWAAESGKTYIYWDGNDWTSHTD